LVSIRISYKALNQRFVMPALKYAILLRYQASSRRNAGSSLGPRGSKSLNPGTITFVVLAREATQEPNHLLFASVGLARPKNRKQYGYISEHHGFGQTHRKASDFAEGLAATMLASTLGIELDPDKNWNERKMVYQVGGRQFVSRSIAQTARGHKDGLWTTVIACAVMQC
jgi:arginine decarboxylase